MVRSLNFLNLINLYQKNFMHKDLSYLGGVIAMSNRYNENDRDQIYNDTFKLCLNDLVNNCTHTDRCDALNEVSAPLAMDMDNAWRAQDYYEFGLLVRSAIQKLFADKAHECTDNVLSTGEN